MLVFLCLERRRVHARGRLATLFWGETGEAHARHSLTQALGRLRGALGDGAIAVTHDTVDWRSPLACDALALFDAATVPASDAAMLAGLHPDDFLADLSLGAGCHDFTIWADQRRVELRLALVRLLERLGRAAQREGRWSDARELGLALSRVEPIYEAAHRRIMLAWSALGERMLALRHFEQFAGWLRLEHGEHPDPATCALAAALRTGAPLGRGPATDGMADVQTVELTVPDGGRPVRVTSPWSLSQRGAADTMLAGRHDRWPR